MSVDWWCEITMKNHKVKLIIFISNRFGREKTKRIIASRSLVISPQSSPEKNKTKQEQQQQPLEKENQVFSFLLLLFDHCFFFCVLFCFSLFFLGGSIQHVIGHASVLLLPIPPGDEEKEEEEDCVGEKQKQHVPTNGTWSDETSWADCALCHDGGTGQKIEKYTTTQVWTGSLYTHKMYTGGFWLGTIFSLVYIGPIYTHTRRHNWFLFFLSYIHI